MDITKKTGIQIDNTAEKAEGSFGTELSIAEISTGFVIDINSNPQDSKEICVANDSTAQHLNVEKVELVKKDLKEPNPINIAPSTDVDKFDDGRIVMTEQEGDSKVNKGTVVIGEVETTKKNENTQPAISPEKPVEIKRAAHLTNDEVTNHTAALWKYKPIPQNEPEPHEEYECLDQQLPGCHIIGASVRGKKHKHEGTNRDDWFEAGNFENITVVVVSDGAGSKKYSRIGARVSCKAGCSYIVSWFREHQEQFVQLKTGLSQPLQSDEFTSSCRSLVDLLQKSTYYAFDEVDKAYKKRGLREEYSKVLGRDLKLSDFAGTFLVSIIIPIEVQGKKEKLILSCQVGDGLIVAINSKESFVKASKLLCEPDSGSFSGETDFLTSLSSKNENYLLTKMRVSRSEADYLLMMSDGVADDYFPNETEAKRLFLDLVVNGIIKQEEWEDIILKKDNVALLRKIPISVAYPWVNNPQKMVALQYVNRIENALPIKLEDLWTRKDILNLASSDVTGFETAIDAADRLKIWLDNYVERGSFDDRTLVIAEL